MNKISRVHGVSINGGIYASLRKDHGRFGAGKFYRMQCAGPSFVYLREGSEEIGVALEDLELHLMPAGGCHIYTAEMLPVGMNIIQWLEAIKQKIGGEIQYDSPFFPHGYSLLTTAPLHAFQEALKLTVEV